jgi:hypothetical protein
MASSIPARLRTYRYDTYIGSPIPNLASDVQGVYGLLNEFTAYCWGTTSSLMLLEYYERFDSIEAIKDYANGVSGTAIAYAEFRYYMEHYLLYAKSHHKDVYKDVMGNARFLKALKVVDARFNKTIASFDKSIANLAKGMRQSGYALSLDGEFLYFEQVSSGSSTGIGLNLQSYNMLAEELAKPSYKAIEKALGVKAISQRKPL